MKGQVKASKYIGEERIHDAGSFFKKFLEGAKKPSLISTESLKSANKTVGSEVKTEFNVVVSQLFGVELKPGSAHTLSQKSQETASPHTKSKEKNIATQEHMEYFGEFKRNSESKNSTEDTVMIRKQLEMILSELRKLKDSSDELETVFKDVVIDEVPEKPGIYHLTFYEGFLKLVMKMRDKVEDGVIYAKLFKSRKQERSYHSMAKKGGTSFTMHQDRAVATQTG